MKSKVKTAEECKALFEIEVSNDAIEKAFVEVYAEIQKVANIPGFRVGKAPIEIVKKQYQDNAKEEVLKRLVPDAYRMALAEHSINPIGLPDISDLSFEEGKPLLFKAKVETRPKFRLKNYKGIKIEKKKPVLKAEEVEKTLQNLRELNAKYVAVEDRPIQLGDYAVCDMECFVGGKPIHKKRENIWLSIDKEAMVPALQENMVGMKKGEERDIDATLPDKYPDKDVAGKTAKYHVKVKEIKSRILPAIDDEFAKDLGKENLETLKKEVAEELEGRMKANSEIDAENQLLKKLIDDNVFSVPPSLYERQLKHMVENTKDRLLQKGFKKDELDKKDEEFKERLKDDALRQVRLFFILDDVAQAEKIEVSAEDMEVAYRAISEQTGKSEEELKKIYEKEDMTGDLEERIREGKVIEFLMKEAVVKEVDN